MITDLKGSKLKNTKSRQAVLEIIKNNSKPVSASEIISLLKNKDINPDEATIYRILDLFFEKGIIKRILTPRSTQAKYELAKDDHHHFTCDNCGKIEDINVCNADKLIEGVKKNKHLLVKGHSLEFFGLCANCQK